MWPWGGRHFSFFKKQLPRCALRVKMVAETFKVVNPTKHTRDKSDGGTTTQTYFCTRKNDFKNIYLRVRWHRVEDVSTRESDQSGKVSGCFVCGAAARPAGRFRPFASTNPMGHWRRRHRHSKLAPGPSKRPTDSYYCCCSDLRHCKTVMASSKLREDGHPTPWKR